MYMRDKKIKAFRRPRYVSRERATPDHDRAPRLPPARPRHPRPEQSHDEPVRQGRAAGALRDGRKWGPPPDPPPTPREGEESREFGVPPKAKGQLPAGEGRGRRRGKWAAGKGNG